jgi:hypothetical protein
MKRAAGRRPSPSAGLVGCSALAADAEREKRNGGYTGTDEGKCE